MGKKSKFVAFGMTICLLCSACGTEGELAKESKNIIVPTAEPVQAMAEGTTDSVENSKVLWSTGTVNAELEEELIAEMELLCVDLEREELFAESILMLESAEWFDIMANNLYEGTRGYTLNRPDGGLLTVQIGINAAGEEFSNIFLQTADHKVKLLQKTDNLLRVLITSMEGQNYHGDFTEYRIDISKGTFIKDSGYYFNGVKYGSCTTCTAVIDKTDFYVIWNEQDTYTYAVTTAEYDEYGNGAPASEETPAATETPQPTATATVTPRATAKATATPKATTTPKATAKPTNTPGRATATPTQNASGGPANGGNTGTSPSPAVTPSGSPSATPTASATPSGSPSATPTASATPSGSPSATPTASATPSGSPSATPTASATPSGSPSAAPTASATPTGSPSASPTTEPTAAPTIEPTATPTAEPEPAETPSLEPITTDAPIVNPEPTESTVPLPDPPEPGPAETE